MCDYLSSINRSSGQHFSPHSERAAVQIDILISSSSLLEKRMISVIVIVVCTISLLERLARSPVPPLLTFVENGRTHFSTNVF